jgi:hypothetical protein
MNYLPSPPKGGAATSVSGVIPSSPKLTLRGVEPSSCHCRGIRTLACATLDMTAAVRKRLKRILLRVPDGKKRRMDGLGRKEGGWVEKRSDKAGCPRGGSDKKIPDFPVIG